MHDGSTPSPFFPEPQSWRAVPAAVCPGSVAEGIGALRPPKASFPDAQTLDWEWAFAWLQGGPVPPVRWTWDPQRAPQGYRLEIGPTGVHIEAGDAQGAWYAVLTLGQWHRVGRTPVGWQGLEVEDSPALPRRGYMLDISRDRVPTLAHLRARIDSIAQLKGNHVELYVEHTFAYAGHEAVHAGYSPITPQEFLALQEHARSRAVELVPNQNTFGHMHRWLRCRGYRALAENPAGDFHAFDYEREPFSLCPTDARSLELVRDLFGQWLPLSDSEWVQGGLDETFDVGRGRSRTEAQQQGLGSLYLGYLQGVARLAQEHGKRLAYWADIVLEHPKVLPDLPDHGMAVLWGYEADHPLETQAKTLREGGVPFWIAAGTSAWQSLTGRWHNAQPNIQNAIAAALSQGAEGVLITDWGDYGHWQPALLSDPACLAFFARAWNPARPLEASEPDFVRALNAWRGWPAESPCGQILWDTVRSSESLQDGARNGTGPFYALRYPPHGPNPNETWTDRAPHFSLAGAQAYRSRLAELRDRLASATDGQDPEWAEWDGLLWAADWATAVAAQRFAQKPIPAALAREGQRMIRAFCHNWSHTSRPGGLYDARRKWRHALSQEEWLLAEA